MAQFDFLATWNDNRYIYQLIDEISGNKYIPHKEYASSSPEMVSAIGTDEYWNQATIRLGIRSVYIWNPTYSFSRVAMYQIASKNTYMVDLNQPLISLLSLGDSVEMPDGRKIELLNNEHVDTCPSGAVRKINLSMISYQDEYPDHLGNWVHRSPELKAGYQRVCSHIKKAMVRHRFSRGYCWIGREAFQLVKEGKALVAAYV